MFNCFRLTIVYVDVQHESEKKKKKRNIHNCTNKTTNEMRSRLVTKSTQNTYNKHTMQLIRSREETKYST